MFCRLGSAEESLPGLRHRLVIRGMNAAGARVDLLRQLVGVGGFELRQRAVVEHDPRQRVGRRRAPPAHPPPWRAARSGSCAAPAVRSFSNSICCSCFGDSTLKSCPASRRACCSRSCSCVANLRALPPAAARDRPALPDAPCARAPAPAAARSPRRGARSAGMLSSFGHSARCRHSVTSASSAAYSAARSTGTWLKLICLAPLPATSSKVMVRRPGNTARRRPCHAGCPTLFQT